MAKILVVDDDPDFVEAMRLTLERNGYTVVSAADGDEGLVKVRSERPDLVILDVIMSSVLDGLNMSRRMSESAEHKRIPILMVTSIANTDYAALFPTDEYVNIDGFLSKPVPPDVLIQRVSELLTK
ncbi:MAG TPA: response regulator [Anaerolineae bacterium]|nr:response regulator [Anaerolineae bacterium]HNT04623.1 response regulator [Anaerolineae bacterium]HOU24635.1 response regulator [Anaerolineae bacterium]HQJ51078.1 response regulator [Anaerolineae bacterium]